MSAAASAVPVDVWRLRVVPDAAARWRDYLLPDELTRAGRFMFDADRARFTITRGALRSLLRRYRQDIAGPLEFVVNQWGKPGLAQGEPRFNVTHSGDWALIAIAHGADVGIDIEHVAIPRHLDELAKSVFTSRELETFATLQGASRHRFFFRTWTCKEAVVKAVGGGLSIPVDRLEMEFGERGLAMVHPDPEDLTPPPWSIQEIDVAEDYAAAVAVRALSIHLQVYDWSYDAAQGI